MPVDEAPYYDARIIRIPVGRVPISLESGAYCDGCWPPVSAEVGADLAEDRASPWIELSDNGRSGDGIALSVHREEHAELEDGGFAGFMIPERSLGLLIAALTSIQLLRKAEADANAITTR